MATKGISSPFTHDLDLLDLLDDESQGLAGRRMPRFDRLAAPARANGRRDDDILGAAPPDRDPLTVDDRALERVVLSGGQLGHDPSPRWHQMPASRVSTSVACSISRSLTHSSAAWASPMSPGPKQIAGMPASFSSAASVHALSPSMCAGSPASPSARASPRTIGASTDTSLGPRQNPGTTWASNSG